MARKLRSDEYVDVWDGDIRRPKKGEREFNKRFNKMFTGKD